MLSVGIDLALRSGAVVKARFLNGNTLTQVDVLSSWETGPRVKAPPLDHISAVQRKIVEILHPYSSEISGKLVLIDWTVYEAFWGSTRSSVMKALVAGYLFRYLLEQECLPMFVPPFTVREKLHLPSKIEKYDVVNWFRYQVSFTEETYPVFMRMNEHEKDATILAYLAKYFT